MRNSRIIYIKNFIAILETMFPSMFQFKFQLLGDK